MRGLAIVAQGGQLVRVNDRLFSVRSQTLKGNYKVEWNGERWLCQCKDFEARNYPCKHIYAVLYLLELPNITLANSAALERSCPYCGSNEAVRNGSRKNKGGLVQVYLCNSCNRRFREGLTAEVKGTNALLMLLALDLYYKGMSLRDIRNHVSQIYNIDKPVSTLHSWILRLTRIVLGIVKDIKPEVGDKWLGDEMVLKVDGKKKYVWNIMDYKTRYQIVSILADGRGEDEAYNALMQAMQRAGKAPHEFVTDGLASYPRAMERVEETGNRIRHTGNVGIRNRTNNNRIERRHGSIKDWVKGKRGMKRRCAEYIEGNAAYYNYIRPHLSLGNQPPSPGFKGNRWASLLSAANHLASRPPTNRRRNSNSPIAEGL